MGSRFHFRRQFLVSTKPALLNKEYFNLTRVGGYYVYNHLDLELSLYQGHDFTILCLGYMIDPDFPKMSTVNILEQRFKNFRSPDEIHLLIYSLTGRFALLIINEVDCYVLNDPLAFRTVYYGHQQNEFFLSSDPNIVASTHQLIKSDDYDRYFQSHYVKNNIEFSLPGNCTLFENIFKLLPNHILNLRTFTQSRFWPCEDLVSVELNTALEKSKHILSGSIEALNRRHKLALALTGGLDSRIMLAASKEFKEDILVYTNKYRNMTENISDLYIPKRITTDLGFDYKIISSDDFVDDDFKEAYIKNSYLSHYHDWGEIALSLKNGLPENSVNVRGNMVELTRCNYYKSGIHPKVLYKEKAYKLKKWPKLERIDNALEAWFNEINDTCIQYNYKQLDFFHWELHGAGWQAQSQLENDIVFETFTLFNNRALIDLIMGVDIKYRIGPAPKFHKSLIRMMMPDLLKYPINPANNFRETMGNFKRQYGSKFLFPISRWLKSMAKF